MTFLIKHCQLLDRSDLADVRLCGTLIKDIGNELANNRSDTIIDAQGGLLLPGLHDHHIHLASLAASMASLNCGPPQVSERDQLAELLASENQRPGAGWLRGTGYHTSVAGDIDRCWLDRHCPDRPIRIQHRGGRMWILNSCALETLGILKRERANKAPEGVEYSGRYATGRLLDSDQWLRAQISSGFPSLAAVSTLLASYGVTGITDCTPANDDAVWNHFHKSQSANELRQVVRLMGSQALSPRDNSAKLQQGEFKIHLLESRLPDMASLCAAIECAHNNDRNVAIHCVTLTELVYALGCLERCGVLCGDRIEHASIAPLEMIEKISTLGLRVVSQPHFILQRGDHYLQEVDAIDQPSLYRLRSFHDLGVPLAAGSDAPFGSADPWLAMQAATTRQTANGASIGQYEALTPEQSLQLYTFCPEHPGVKQRSICADGPANLCLLDASWRTTRARFSSERVRATWILGELVYRKAHSDSGPV